MYAGFFTSDLTSRPTRAQDTTLVDDVCLNQQGCDVVDGVCLDQQGCDVVDGVCLDHEGRDVVCLDQQARDHKSRMDNMCQRRMQQLDDLVMEIMARSFKAVRQDMSKPSLVQEQKGGQGGRISKKDSRRDGPYFPTQKKAEEEVKRATNVARRKTTTDLPQPRHRRFWVETAFSSEELRQELLKKKRRKVVEKLQEQLTKSTLTLKNSKGSQGDGMPSRQELKAKTRSEEQSSRRYEQAQSPMRYSVKCPDPKRRCSGHFGVPPTFIWSIERTRHGLGQKCRPWKNSQKIEPPRGPQNDALEWSSVRMDDSKSCIKAMYTLGVRE